ncbi:MAG: hypothetical protein CSA22_00410 [Deltaproteobacteria bacterium]|nr:MAG: hypothetical protein CSA22_00410 [Deltaproteobacteria bacterium]
MPGFNRTGPNGEGPKTGGGFGVCGGRQGTGGRGRRLGRRGAGYGGRCRGDNGQRMTRRSSGAKKPTSQVPPSSPASGASRESLADRAAALKAELAAIEKALNKD